MALIRKIIHIDMDAFFAAIEQRENPALRGKPLIVGGDPNTRGVVATCSYEARAYGIRSAMPSKTAYRLCPEAIFVRPRMPLYREVSQQIMQILHSYTDAVEPIALDEAYLDITSRLDRQPSATITAREIKQQIVATTGLTASAGVSFNKLLAKIASGYRKPDGMTVVPPERAAEFIGPLPVRKFFGIGKISEERLRSIGINTGADLRQMSEDQLVTIFKERGKLLYQFAQGIDPRPVNPSRGQKSLGKEYTLPVDSDNRDELGQIIQRLAEQLAEQLTRHQAQGFILCIKARLSDFRIQTRRMTTKEPLNNATTIYSYALHLLQALELGTLKVRTIGLSIHKLNQVLPNYVRLLDDER